MTIAPLESELALNEKQRAAIGCVVVESAYLERYVETILYGLTNLKREKGQFLIEKNMLDSKLDALKEIGQRSLKSKKRKLELSDLVGRMKHANADRTVIVHGTWSAGIIYAQMYGDGKPVAQKRRAGSQDSHFKIDNVMAAARAINRGNWELHAFVEKCWPRLARLPRLRTRSP